MKPINNLPDDYKLRTVFDLDKDKQAKKSMLYLAYVAFLIVGSLFFIHLYFLFQNIFAKSSTLFIVWILGIIISPVVVTIGNYLLERQILTNLTGENL